MKRVKASQNDKGREFKNTVFTQNLIEGESTIKIIWDGFFAEKAILKLAQPLSTINSNLQALDITKNTVIWLGGTKKHYSLVRRCEVVLYAII